MASKAGKTKKTPPKQKTSRPKAAEKTRKQILTKELTELFKLLDEQGLEFLKHQAEVLLHNSRIEEVRKKAAQQVRGPAGRGRQDEARDRRLSSDHGAGPDVLPRSEDRKARS